LLTTTFAKAIHGN